MIDEEGEPVVPSIAIDPPKHEVLMLGFELRRCSTGALTNRGYSVPLLRMNVATTEGEIVLYMTRDECVKFSLALSECACDA